MFSSKPCKLWKGIGVCACSMHCIRSGIQWRAKESISETAHLTNWCLLSIGSSSGALCIHIFMYCESPSIITPRVRILKHEVRQKLYSWFLRLIIWCSICNAIITELIAKVHPDLNEGNLKSISFLDVHVVRVSKSMCNGQYYSSCSWKVLVSTQKTSFLNSTQIVANKIRTCMI